MFTILKVGTKTTPENFGVNNKSYAEKEIKTYVECVAKLKLIIKI